MRPLSLESQFEKCLNRCTANRARNFTAVVVLQVLPQFSLLLYAEMPKRLCSGGAFTTWSRVSTVDIRPDAV
jgi:hypothetical protein